MFYLMAHTTHLDHLDSERETCCQQYMGYSFRLTVWVLLHAPSHRQDSTYHSLCYTSYGILAGTRNSSTGNLYNDKFSAVQCNVNISPVDKSVCFKYIIHFNRECLK